MNCFYYYFLYLWGNCVCWTSWGWFVALSDFQIICLQTDRDFRARWLIIASFIRLWQKRTGQKSKTKTLPTKNWYAVHMIIQLVIQREGAAVPPSPTPPPPKKTWTPKKEGASYDDSKNQNLRRNSCDNTSTILEPESRKVKDKWELPAQLPDWNFRVWLVLVPISLG